MNSRRIINAAGASVALSLLLVSAGPARSADPVYPVGSRIGLVPPAGMVPIKALPGFQDPANNAAILITALPAAAYAEMEKSAVTDVLKKQGITVEKREPVQFSFGKGFLIIGKQVTDKEHYRKWLLVAAADDLTVFVSVQLPEQDRTYPDKVVRAALDTLSLRATVPDAERLSLLPFTVGNLAGFRIDDVLPGRALMLVDAPKEASKEASKDASKDTTKDPLKDATEPILDARLLIAALAGGPTAFDDHGNFARLVFNDIGGIKDVRITMSEPLRLGGQQGFQTMAQAKDARTGIDVMVVQWLRFGNGGFLQMVGISRADIWTSELERLRTVRDSVELQ